MRINQPVVAGEQTRRSARSLSAATIGGGEIEERNVERKPVRTLEQLVGWIESRFSPRGFKVETRKSVLDDSGVQVAEFDILITGYIGTAPVT